jgi:hypothetical protein
VSAPFDPAAWVAEYEALGGHVSVVQQTGKYEGLWLGITYPRDPRRRRRGYAMQAELNDPTGDPAKTDALTDYVIEARGVRAVGRQP